MIRVFAHGIAWIRSLLMIPVFFIFSFFVSLTALIEGLTFNYRPFEDWLSGFWARGTCFLFGVEVSVFGAENLGDDASLLLFNHTSFFDIFAIQSVFPHVRFGSKIELFSIPIFGQAMRLFGILPITRHDREKVIQVYKRAQSRTQKGEQFVLSPEGGRGISGELLPFKAGPFIFAIHSKMKAVPIVVRGALPIMNKKTYIPNTHQLKSRITLEVLPGHDASLYSEDTYKLLKDAVYQQMKERLEALPAVDEVL